MVLALAACASPEPPANPAGVIIKQTRAAGALHGTVLDRPSLKPALTFTDTEGRPFRLDRDTTRPVTVLFFGYTHCPDVCSTVLADAAAALRRLDPGTRKRVQLVFVTVDPARDTPAVIRDYLVRFDPTFVGLTAALPVIEQAAESLGVALTGSEQVPGGYEVGHGTQLIGFGPDGRAGVVWLPGTPVADLREDLARLASGT